MASRPIRVDDLPALFPDHQLRRLQMREIDVTIGAKTGPHNLLLINNLATVIRRELIGIADEACAAGCEADISIMISVSHREKGQ